MMLRVTVWIQRYHVYQIILLAYFTTTQSFLSIYQYLDMVF